MKPTPTGRLLTPIKFLFVLLLLPTCLLADCSERPALLSLGAGTFDTFRPKEKMFQFQAEVKWSACWHGIQPITALMVTEKGSVYFCAGACIDLFLAPHLVLTPSFAPGVYFKNNGKDLGYPLEFRSSISLATQFRDCNRLGIQFYHISNASLGHKNPGEESLILFFGFALP